jgi:hypothetical protein
MTPSMSPRTPVLLGLSALVFAILLGLLLHLVAPPPPLGPATGPATTGQARFGSLRNSAA